jgi:hypothetical protein
VLALFLGYHGLKSQMDRGSSITPRDLECRLCDETGEPKALLSLLEEIKNGFSDKQKLAVVGSQWFIRYSNSELPWSRLKFIWKLK